MRRVGPRSSGADPGPACYGRGGTAPTVPDADLVLGRIEPGQFAGGKIALHPERAERAVAATISEPWKLRTNVGAAGIAEMKFGAGKGRKGLVLIVTIGTGLGTALFLSLIHI